MPALLHAMCYRLLKRGSIGLKMPLEKTLLQISVKPSSNARGESKCWALHTQRKGKITSTNFHHLCIAGEATDNDIKNIMHTNKTQDLQGLVAIWGGEK